jgi:hypothetical protein
LNDLRNLITSTIVDDFDKNPNIWYVVNSDNSSSQTLSTTSSSHQPRLPNPFVSKALNQKITNEIQQAIATTAASSNSSSNEKHVEIKCTFGIILADYNCSWF